MSIEKYREELRSSLCKMYESEVANLGIDEKLDLNVNSLAGILIGIGPEKVGQAISSMDAMKFNEFAKKIDGKGIGMITDQIALSTDQTAPDANNINPEASAPTGEAPAPEASPVSSTPNTGASTSDQLLKDL